jgi:hypothetical protein
MYNNCNNTGNDEEEYAASPSQRSAPWLEGRRAAQGGTSLLSFPGGIARGGRPVTGV